VSEREKKAAMKKDWTFTKKKKGKKKKKK